LYSIQWEAPFEANLKLNKMDKLLDNDYFRDLLFEADENELMSTAIFYVPASLISSSLISNREYFHEFLLYNYEDEFDFTETEDEDVMHTEMSLYLSTKTRHEKVHIYLGFMTSYGMIEDLMCLNLEERYELAMDLDLLEIGKEDKA
jgi:hypothetical protein